MDKIIIRGLKIKARHGVKDFEKITPQTFLFDADIFCDFYAAAADDDLEKTINYSSVCKIITSVTQGNVFNLIEKLAYECAYAVMEALPAQKITLTVYKPEAPVKAEFDSVGVSVEISRERAVLSIGSSIGDRKKYLDAAVEKLNTYRGITVKKVSTFIETEPFGGVARNKFLNGAVEVETLLSPQGLLQAAHDIENECGRERTERWGDRTLDIDIIFFGKRIIRSDDLIIPHAGYADRDFVMIPLKEIVPDFVCPLCGKPVKDI